MNRYKRIYISGPMSGLPREEYLRNFREAEKELRDKGFIDIVNPIRVWACRWPWLYRIVGYRLTLWYDILLLKGCNTIYLLDGWEKSAGARKEYKVAWRRNMRMLTQLEDKVNL